jgi:glutaredoxin 3
MPPCHQQTEIRNQAMPRVKVYSTASCPFCVKAKQLLDKWNIPYEEARIDTDQAARRDFARDTNSARTVPQIIIDGVCIGGFTELTELHMEDKLEHLIEQ